MARLEYTRTIEQYSFSVPQFVSEENYNLMKLKIKMNPNLPLVDGTKAESKHEQITILVVIGFIALGIGLFGMLSSENPPGWSILLLLISVFGILHPLVNMGTFQSSQNCIRAEREKNQYFERLKQIVISSYDYRSFQDNYRNAFFR
jgi:hypothetical protein